MNRQALRRFAPVGLAVAGLAALAAAGLYVVQRSFTLPIQISLALIVLGIAAFIILNPEGARRALTGRQARYGSNALLMTLAFLGIVVVINYLVYNNSRQWDLTEDQSNSLLPESIQALESLQTPVTAVAYYTPDMSSAQAEQLLSLYKANSRGKFEYEIIDPIPNQIRAEQDKVTRNGTIVLKMDGRSEQVTFPSEEEITGAVVRLANPGERVVYFLEGHGEFSLDTTSENNYADVRAALEAKNYTVNSLNLLTAEAIPEDALALIAAGPTKPFSPDEVQKIRAYQEKGGALVYLAEPRAQTEFGDAADPMQVYLQEMWGIVLGEDVVIEPASQQALVAISQRFQQHPITQKMYNLSVVMPIARSVSRIPESIPQEIQLTELAYSSDMAWGETDVAGIEQNRANPDQGVDHLGPVSLAVAGENTATGARVLVVGDSDFAGARAYAQLGNSSFILNSVDWAAEQEGLISLNPRQPTQRIIVPQSVAAMGLILLGTVFLLPGLVLFMGITTWLQRRSRG